MPTIVGLQRQCGFNDGDFNSLHSAVCDSLNDPDHSIALDGVQAPGWEDWLDRYLDGGIGEVYWGKDEGHKWKYPQDRVKFVLLSLHPDARTDGCG
jgi:hypothetical protein